MKKPNLPVWLVLAGLLALAGCGREQPTAYQGYVEGEFVYVAGKIGGRLDELRVARGDRVAAGDMLFVLEHEFEAQAVAQASADLRQAQDTLRDREKGLRPEEIAQIVADLKNARAASALSELQARRRTELYKKDVIAKEDMDIARTTSERDRQTVRDQEARLATGYLASRIDQIRAAQAAVEAAAAVLGQAQWNLDEKTQQAGVGGLVFDTLHYQGEWVAAGSPVVALLPPENVKARFFVPEAVAGSLAVGQAIRVACDGCGQPAQAVISFISPQVEYTPPVIFSQEFREKLVIMVEARFAPDVARRMHPGQPLDVTLDTATPGGGR